MDLAIWSPPFKNAVIRGCEHAMWLAVHLQNSKQGALNVDVHDALNAERGRPSPLQVKGHHLVAMCGLRGPPRQHGDVIPGGSWWAGSWNGNRCSGQKIV